MSSTASPARVDGLIVLAIVVLIAAVFGPTVTHDFVGYDDPFYVTDNPTVQRGLTPSGFVWAFRHGADAAYWTPITFLSHMLDVQLFGMHPGGHHFTNVVLHAGNSVLLYFVLMWLTGDRWPSAVVAGLFAVHPMRVESVAWIAERKSMLSGLALLLCVMAYTAWTRRGGGWRYALVVGAFILGMMCKPILVSLPLLLLILDFWPLERFAHPSRKLVISLLLEKVPLLAISLVFSVLTVVAQRQAGAMRTFEQFPLGFRMTNAVVAYARYLGKTVWPTHLAVFYPPPEAWPAVVVAVALLLLLAITLVALMKRRSMPYLLAGWLWFLLTLLPVIGLVQVGRQAMADRYTHIAHIGLFIAIAWTAWRWAQSTPRARLAATVIAAAVIVAAAGRAGDQVRHWKNTQTLFEHALGVTENNAVAMLQVGNARVRSNRLEEGEALYRRALELDPDYGMAHLNLANLLARRREFAQAVEHYEAALRWRDDLPRAYLGMGVALSGLQQYDRADQAFAEAVRRAPHLAETHLAWGMSLKSQGRFEEAAEQFHAALKINPRLAIAQRELDHPQPASAPPSSASAPTSAPGR